MKIDSVMFLSEIDLANVEKKWEFQIEIVSVSE